MTRIEPTFDTSVQLQSLTIKQVQPKMSVGKFVLKLIFFIIWLLIMGSIVSFFASVFFAPDPKDNVNVSISNTNRGGFGTVIIADINIYNGNKTAVGDIKFTCNGFSRTGTRIDSNTRTIYEYVEPFNYKTIKGYNIGYVHSDVSYFKCQTVNIK